MRQSGKCSNMTERCEIGRHRDRLDAGISDGTNAFGRRTGGSG
jgi:hypothetical protein